MNLVLAGPSQLYVKWSCRKCGHEGGVARTTIPVTAEWTEPMVRTLLSDLARSLPAKHQRYCVKAGKPICLAVPDDFRVERFVPTGKTLIDNV